MRWSVAFVSLVVVGLSVGFVLGVAGQPKKGPVISEERQPIAPGELVRVEWEYKAILLPWIGMDKELNKLGKDGWDLLFADRVVPRIEGDWTKDQYRCIFKRPVLPKVNPSP